jgi:hypothetical protein
VVDRTDERAAPEAVRLVRADVLSGVGVTGLAQECFGGSDR